MVTCNRSYDNGEPRRSVRCRKRNGGNGQPRRNVQCRGRKRRNHATAPCGAKGKQCFLFTYSQPTVARSATSVVFQRSQRRNPLRTTSLARGSSTHSAAPVWGASNESENCFLNHSRHYQNQNQNAARAAVELSNGKHYSYCLWKEHPHRGRR